MTRYAVAVGSNGSRSLVGLEDLRPVASASGLRAVMMARPDIVVRVIELPALDHREIAGFLAYRIRSLYPGQPDETAFDHQELTWGGRRYAVLFLVHRQVLEEHRRVAGGRPLFLPHSLLVPLLRRASPARVTVALLWHAAWIDALVLEPDKPPRTVTLPRTAGVAGDLERFEDLLAVTQAIDWRVVCIEGEVAALRKTLESRRPPSGSVTVAALEASVQRLGRRLPVPFVRRSRPAGVPRRVRIPIAILALAALSYLVLKRSVDQDAAYASLLSRTVQERQVRAGELAALQREVDGLQAGLSALQADRPPDPGQVLAELVAVLGAGTRLESFSLENGFFQLEAVGNNPLQLMERFASHGAFEEVRLLQIIPQKDGARELFRVTGRAR